MFRLWEIFCSEKMPVWLTMLSSIVAGATAALVTYHYAPDINAKFEATKASSQYILENLKLLNADTSEVLANIGVYNRTVLRGSAPETELRVQIERRLSALQWRALEYDLIFQGPEAQRVLRRYRLALDSVGAAVDAQPVDIPRVVASGRELAESSHELMRLLTLKADIRESFKAK
jgi:hypothetical protein